MAGGFEPPQSQFATTNQQLLHRQNNNTDFACRHAKMMFSVKVQCPWPEKRGGRWSVHGRPANWGYGFHWPITLNLPVCKTLTRLISVESMRMDRSPIAEVEQLMCSLLSLITTDAGRNVLRIRPDGPEIW